MDKAERFKETATKRVETACRALRAVGNLSGPAYEFTESQVGEIFAYLQERIDKEKARFCAQAGFRFSEGGDDGGPGKDD